MESFVIAVVSMAVVLGIMILVHEFGHYAAAKFFGVKVEVFSIGFGKRLWGFRRGDTDYRVSALPLGGYVKMAGENPLESRSGAPDEFMSHPRWQRFVIAIAGPAMNIILAVALLTGVNMVRYEHPVYLDQPAIVGWVLETFSSEPKHDAIIQGEIASSTHRWRAGFHMGRAMLLKVMIGSKQPTDVAIQRGTQILSQKVDPLPEGSDPFLAVGVPDEPLTVTTRGSSMPASQGRGESRR